MGKAMGGLCVVRCAFGCLLLAVACFAVDADCNYDGCAAGKGNEIVCRVEDVECTSWLLLPGWNSLPVGFRAVAYFLGLMYCFLGIAVVSDVFMGAIEQITSQEVVAKLVEGRQIEARYKVWNPTIANLSLMALGSSAPEILLAVIDTVNNLAPACSSVEECQDADHVQHPPQLGASTIVGSAAFNLLIISAVCMLSVPRGEVRRIDQFGVFAVTAFFSILAYLWLYFVLGMNSRDYVDMTEAVVTFVFFPCLLILAYLQSNSWLGLCQKKQDPAFQRMTDVELRDTTDNASSKFRAVAMKLREQQLRDGSVDGLSVLKEAAAQSAPSALQFRINGARKLGGKRRVIPNNSLSTDIPELHDPKKDTAAVIEFVIDDIAVMENCGEATFIVERKGNTSGIVEVQCFTSDGTATAGQDYTPFNQTIRFQDGETRRTVSVRILEDDQVEDDETFFVTLANPKNGAQLGQRRMCTVTIIDNDSPGVLQFAAPTATVTEDAGFVELEIVREHGTSGIVSVDFTTKNGSAVQGEDYEATEGTLIFANGETRKKIKVRILEDDKIEDDETFTVLLRNPRGSPNAPLLGTDRSCVVTIIDNNQTKQMALKIVDLLAARESHLSTTTSTWAEQFLLAVNLQGETDFAGRDLPPSVLDYVLHLLSLGWKVLFAFIPPTSIWHGWLAFFVALVFIGMVTSVVAEFAALFGCVIGMPDSVTAITFVAIGTSLPDTFASRQATRESPNADAAIGNITGSNSVNVFLGLGLPWVIAAVYHKYYRKDLYSMPAGDLGYSVQLFLICAGACLIILVLKRLNVLGGGELGGSALVRYTSTLVFVVLWVVYVTLASLNSISQE